MDNYGEEKFYRDLFARKDLAYEEAREAITDFWRGWRHTPKGIKESRQQEIWSAQIVISAFFEYDREDWAWKEIEYLEKNYPEADVDGIKGRVYFSRGNYKKAIGYLEKSYAKTKSMLTMEENLIPCLLELGRANEAEKRIAEYKLYKEKYFEKKINEEMKIEDWKKQSYDGVIKRFDESLERVKMGKEVEYLLPYGVLKKDKNRTSKESGGVK